MGSSENKLYLVDMVKSWIPRRTEPPNVSRDFWMPDQSCRVCYECDSQFTIFNRKHHCRLCGRVFCAKCTMNSIPAHSDDGSKVQEDCEKIRVCNYCFKQWKQGVATINNGSHVQTPGISPSPSLTSLGSSSSSTYLSSNSTVGSFSFSTGPYQNISYTSGQSSSISAKMTLVTEPENITSESKENFSEVASHSSSNQCHYWLNRSDEDEDYGGAYHFDNDISHYSHASDYYDAVNVPEIHHVYEAHEMPPDSDNTKLKSLSCSMSPPQRYVANDVDELQELERDGDEHDQGDGCESSAFDMESGNVEPVDFENNGLLWLPPEPEDKEDEREVGLFDDDDEGTTGEWGYLRTSSSFGSGEYRSKDKSSEEHRNAMKNVLEGHFKALVSQLLQVENLPIGDENDKEGWLEIITSLSWEAASLLKPDTSKSAGMDPGGYVKVKCLACGHRSESVVVKGVVCKKNVAHRRMTSMIEKPRFLILGGALEYQRVSNTLSSFDTLLQQEKDHLKMAVAKIDAHQPSVLLVEKSVSRYAQEYLHAKDISLVLNIKRPLLERIARCTGAQIVPSIDHLTSQKLGYCETFHVEKFFEEHGSAGLGGKKLTKTLMFFEGCPKPFGCTILLKGAHGDELKRVKHVVQYGIFAAYHLAMETSFLADEGASLPELPLTSPVTVSVPNKASSINRSISTVPGFSVPSSGEFSGDDLETYKPSSSVMESRITSDMRSKSELSCSRKIKPDDNLSSPKSNDFPTGISFQEIDEKTPTDSLQCKRDGSREGTIEDNFASAPRDYSEPFGQAVHAKSGNATVLATDDNGNQGSLLSMHGTNGHNECSGSSKEEFSPSPSDQQGILVFLSTRCVWSGTVCEASHFVRIKYYGSSDKPLGRFLRDRLFDQSYRCDSCDKPSEAHVHCYTHRHGSLTISVKKLSETLLPGERDGKIWMWHRCLKCPRINGFPPATRRVVMSDAAWGLSFGKFLELSFSNHAAASRVASCGHSLHRDCLRFYGLGKMVACFRYASIDLHSVYLPPAKLEFSYNKQEWMQIEANEVQNMAESLFRQVQSAINQIATKISDVGDQGSIKKDEFMYPLLELKETLRKEREEFEELLQKVLYREVNAGQYVVDILELYKLRRLIMLHSYVWDQRLINAANMIRSLLGDLRSPLQNSKEKRINSSNGLTELNVSDRSVNSYSSCVSFHLEAQEEGSPNKGEGSEPGEVHQGQHTNGESLNEKLELLDASVPIVSNMQDPLEGGRTVRRALSEGEHHVNLSDSLDAAWTGESHPPNIPIKEKGCLHPEKITILPSSGPQFVTSKSSSENLSMDKAGSSVLTCTSGSPMRPDIKWMEIAFSNFYSSFNKILPQITPKVQEYVPVYITLIRDLDRQNGARLLFPSGVNDTVVPVYDDEPTSIVAHALVSMEYHAQMSESDKDASGSLPLLDSTKLLSFNSCDEAITDAYRSLTDESVAYTSGSRNSQVMDPLTYRKDLHIRVSFTDESSLGKVNYNVTCYYAKRFDALRRICCPSELDFIRSLSRCKKWGAQGGKSNVFFAKTLDDRFIVKQVTKTELESFIKFAPAYFKYLSESISTGSPTCLAKILGIYQVSSKHLKGGKETKMDILVMENLLFGRNVTRVYDLKGSSRSRYNPDTSGNNKVLLDQNLIESMPTSPIFVGNKPKRLLGRAVWNDSGFLASVHVMDYSLLVGVDEQKHELVLGIIDFMRQYTWDKHLETWVKTSGILGGPKNATPTVISPQQYKKRFRKAMGAYFLMVPEWSPPVSQPSGSLSDFCDEKS